MERVYSFSSEPSMIPCEVLEAASGALVNYKDTGMSVMELGAGNPEYTAIFAEAESLLRELLKVPQGYKVFFMNGGSDEQYSAIPLNLLSDHNCSDYVLTGRLSKQASIEAKKYGDIAIAANSAGATPAFSTVPYLEQKHFRPDADYVHICFNNTYYGTKFNYVPKTGNIPLVADMSSFLFSEPVEVNEFALIYASAASCLGISGMTIVIVRDDLAAGAFNFAPSTLNYKSIQDKSLDLKPASVWNVYLAKLTFEWIKSIGGLEEIKRRNERKASLIYDYLDSQTYYTAPVDKNCRSMMNVIFIIGDASLDAKFAKEASAEGLCNLGGHSSVGGMCASIYNSISIDGVEKLVRFMKRFAQENPKLDT